jgi:predicted CopG family antitoxin
MAITKLKRIAVHETVYEQLREMGKTGESFNDVIVKMLEIVKLQPVNSKVGTEEDNQAVTSPIT